MKYFTSDLHLGHQRIIELCNRPFKSVEDMNKTLIQNINDMVTPGDILYILGDIAMGNMAETLPMLEEINCSLILVPGNHDKCHPLSKKAAKYLPTYENLSNVEAVFVDGYASVHGWMVRVNHFPYYGDPFSRPQYELWAPNDENDWLMHGHVHNQWFIKDKMINVGVDVNGYQPLSEDEILSIIKE